MAVSSAVSAKEYDSTIVNLAGRQRMLTQKYTLEINQVLVALAVSDWELAVELKEAAYQTAELYEATLATFFEGGEVDAGEQGRVWIPPAQGVDLVDHLGDVKIEWEELRRTAIQAMHSDSPSLVRNDCVRDVQTQTNKAVAEMDHVVTLMQKQSEARLRRVDSYMLCAFIINVVSFVGTVLFVRTKIVVPLDRSTTALETEIAERKSAEAELRKLSVAVEQSPASVVITDTQGTIEYVNPRFTEVTGYTAEEAIGQNPRILKSGKKPKEAYKKLWDTILAGKVWTGAFENRKKNGELYWEEASICPIRDAEGAITNFLAVKQDITERKEAERTLQEAHDMLEQRVEERTRALRKASQAKSEFLATMSHELRTPLNGVIGMTELLLGTDLDAQQRKQASIAKSSGDLLLNLINDILDFSKIEAGKLDLEFEEFNLPGCLKTVVSTMAQTAENKHLELLCYIDSAVPPPSRPGCKDCRLIHDMNSVFER